VKLHWFDVTLATRMRDIGWVWVALVAALVVVAWAICWLVREWKDRP
jgi:hypothetical protein